jgi:Ca-activated chloride channel homolog
MRFLSASALWWLLLSAPIIFFYLLKLKRKRHVVPSVLLWQRALDEIEANAPFRRLRRSLLLLLQLLILAAVVFALARPLLTTRALASGSTVIIIDSTASMSTKDQDGRSRLERARELAREMVDGLSGSDRAAIVESGARVAVRSPLTADRNALTNAIDEVTETGAAGNLSDALVLAEQIAKAEREAGIVVIGDGGGNTDVSHEAARNPAEAGAVIPLRFVRVGTRADNAGIVAMNSRGLQGGTRQELFAAIGNFSTRHREVGVELRIDGKLVDVRTASLGPNDRKALIYDSLPQSGGLAELKLDLDDDLAADNVAYAHLSDARKPRIVIASDNPFLLRALAVNPDFDARRITPGEAFSEVDCVVSEGLNDSGVLESNRPVLLINPSDSEGRWRSTGELEKPEVASVNRAHPVNDYLSYSDLHIESASKRDAASWLKPIVGTASDGLIWAGDDGHRRVVMIGFDLARTDLPLKVEFPLLLANSISWLVGRDASASERVVRTGQPITLRGTESVALTLPDGRAEELRTEGGAAIFADTLQVGIYSVGDAQPFAATLLSEMESDTTPRDSIRAREGEVSGKAETFQSEREAWKWVALAALLLMAIEWWVYHKRIAG